MALAIYALISRIHTDDLEIKTIHKIIHTFAIVIPAHNEENVILDSLHSCAKLDYPRHKYKVFVIADNCSDHTAEIAVQSGVTCLERHDLEHIGKGFALAWAFDRILPKGYDAIIVLDADCRLESCALHSFSRYLEDGNKVLQASLVASNPDVSAVSYALAVGNFIEKALFYSPKSRLGLAVFLQGTGMVFHREALQAYPWKAHSIVEDVEYTLKLLKQGICVKFVDETQIISASPVQGEQLKVQRTRWARGNVSFGKRYALKLMWEGLVKKQWLLIDAGWTLLVLSRPLVLLELFITVVFAVLCSCLWPNSLSNGLLVAAIILVLIQGLYFALGIALFGISLRRIVLLLSTPVVVVRLIIISLLGLIGVDKNTWARTPR